MGAQMSTIKIKNANQLAQFLKVLAEESVASAQVDVDSERKRQKSTASATRRDLGRFMQEEDVPGTEPAPAAPPPADLATDPNASAAPPEAAPAAKPAAPAPGEEDPLEPSFDAMTRAILDLRSGKSVKDSAIETELEAYYDRLQDAERYAMIIFLRALSGIVTGKMTGAQAAEPGDEPHGISITRAGEEEGAAPAPDAPAEPAPSDTPAAPAPEEAPPAPAGPIQVGSPVSEAFRDRIRQLIRANR
jgi:hypothetical protein